MSDCLMVRTLSGLAPTDETGWAILRRIAIGVLVKVKVVRPREYRNLKRWHALCKIISDNVPGFENPDVAHGYLKILAGHFWPVVSPEGEILARIPRSISYAAMDEDEWQTFWGHAVRAICEHLIPTMTEPVIEQEVLRLVGYVG